MSLRYDQQNTGYAIGSESTPATLTASYDDNVQIFHTADVSQLTLYIAYTVNVLSSNRILYVQLEGGPDQSDFYKLVTSSLSSGTETLNIKTAQFTGATGGTTYKFRVSEPIADQEMRLSVKESGSDNFGTVTIRLMKSG